MIYEVENYVYNINHNINCGISGIMYSLLKEGIKISENDIALYSNYASFDFWPVIDYDGITQMLFCPLALNFFDQFSKRTNAKMKHYNIEDDDEDFQVIVDAVRNNHCVNVMCDQYYIGYAICEQVRLFFSPVDNRMPFHFITIHGVDTENKRVLFTEPIFNLQSSEHWISYEELNRARKVSWRNLSVNRDLFIFDDVSDFSPVSPKSALHDQIESLIHKIPDTLAQKDSFIEKYINNNDSSQKCIEDSLNSLRLCLCGFDLSLNFYRRYIYRSFNRILGDCEITQSYKELYHSWHSTAKLADKLLKKKNKTYDDFMKVVNSIEENARTELALNKTALPFLEE